jgi:uncharacterized membrane protein YhhN
MIPNLPLLLLTFFSAVAHWFVLARQWRTREYIAKPAVMVFLLLWMVYSAGLQGPLAWFALGLVFSLAGDVFLMISVDKFFVPGLAAFLLAHVAYIIGLNDPLPQFSLGVLGIALLIGISALRVMRRIVQAIEARGMSRLRLPVILYANVITLMLLSALLTLYRAEWSSGAALLVSVGALLFYISDIVLAWNKLVNPIKNGRLLNISLYHLGQITLIVGVVLQFG